MKTNRTKKVYAFINNKGGVGKSRSAVSLSEYLTAKGVAHKAIDADSEPGRLGTLKRFLPDAEELVAATNNRGRRLWDRLLEATEEADVVIADMPGGASAHFVSWFAESDVLGALEAMDIELVMVVPVCENRDSIMGLRTLWDGVGPEAQKGLTWVIIQNEKDGETITYLESKTRKEVLAAGARELTFSAFNFDPAMNRALDCARGANNEAAFLTFSRLIESKQFSILQTARLRNFQKRLFEQFASVGI